MALLQLPNELLLFLPQYLEPFDIYCLIQTNRHLAHLFIPVLHKIAMQDHEGMPSLSWAAKKGHIVLVGFLLDKGADINPPRPTPPLTLAAASGHKEVVKLLLQRGANAERTNFEGSSALLDAIFYKNVAVCRLLLEHRERTNLSRGLGPGEFVPSPRELRGAVSPSEPNLGLIKLLLRYGARLDGRDDIGRTVLHIMRNHAAMELLIKEGADIDARDNGGNTPLHANILDINIVEFLVDSGANTLIRNNTGRTPLMIAISYQRVQSTRMLLEKTPIDDDLRTELIDIARSSRFNKALEMLQEHKARTEKTR